MEKPIAKTPTLSVRRWERMELPTYPPRKWFNEPYVLSEGDKYKTAQSECLILDPTYTGKAFRALEQLMTDGEITLGSRVLFWHTGGLLNLCAASHFFASKDFVL